MRNLLVIASGVIAGLLLCGFQEGTAPATKADSKAADGRHQNADQGQDTPAAPAPSRPVANPSSPNPSKEGNKSQDHEVKVTSLPEKIEIRSVKDSIDWTVLGCTVVLTIVGIVGTIVALKTLSAIKRQAEIMDEHRVSLEQLARAAQDNAAAANKNAEATEKDAAAAKASADAAKKSADGFLNAERAWVMVDVTCDCGSELTSESSSGDVSTALTDTQIKCHNTGHSPGWITEKVIKLSVLQRPLPEYLVLDDPRIVISESEPISPGETTEEKLELIQGQGRHSFVGGTVLVVYGRISYRDIFNENRETWFCYRMEGFKNARRLKRMPEYPEYNRHT